MAADLNGSFLAPSSTLEQINDEEALPRIPAIIYTGVLMVVGIIGNTLICYVYSLRLKMTPTNHFIIVLAVLDILSCCIAMPTEIVDMRYPFMFPSILACKVLRFLTYFTTGSSCSILLTIALDRYSRVCHPFSTHLSLRQARGLSALLIAVSIGCTAPMFYLSGKMSHRTRVANITGTDCSIADSVRHTNFPRIYFGSVFVGIISFFVAISICYFLLWLRVRHRQRKMRANSAIADGGKSKKKLDKTTVVVFLVTLLFVLSYIPCLTLQIVRTVVKYETSLSPVAKIFYCMGLRSYFLSNSLNPIIYGYFNKQVKDEFKKIFVRVMRINTDTSSSTSNTSNTQNIQMLSVSSK